MTRRRFLGWTATGFVLVGLGVTAALLSMIPHGLIRGLLLGAAIVFNVAGATVLGGTLGWRGRGSGPRDGWLPSRDR